MINIKIINPCFYNIESVVKIIGYVLMSCNAMLLFSRFIKKHAE